MGSLGTPNWPKILGLVALLVVCVFAALFLLWLLMVITFIMASLAADSPIRWALPTTLVVMGLVCGMGYDDRAKLADRVSGELLSGVVLVGAATGAYASGNGLHAFNTVLVMAASFVFGQQVRRLPFFPHRRTA